MIIDIEGIKVFNRDCVEVMNEIGEGGVDLTVTSPPYDKLRSYNGAVDAWGEKKWKETLSGLYRVTKNGGVVVWVVGDSTIKGSETGTSFRQALYAMEIGFSLHDTMIYKKTGVVYPDTNRYYQMFEYMFVFSKGKPKTTNLISDHLNSKGGCTRSSGGYRQSDGSIRQSCRARHGLTREVKEYGVRSNIWEYTAGYNSGSKDKYIYEHPATFPEALAHDHIVSWSNEGDIVFDPFLGSGTTAKMAILANRKVLGTEIDPTYFKIAEQRIYEAYSARRFEKMLRDGAG